MYHFTIVDITYCNLTSFLYYKDIRKALFTMATLLMLLLENVDFQLGLYLNYVQILAFYTCY